MSEIDIARAIAVAAHTGQKYGSRDYFTAHVLAVANEVCLQTQGDPDLVAVAYLHDVVEDTNVSIDRLAKAGVNNRVRRLVNVLTRRTEESYESYIQRVLESGRDARLVKLADLTVNMRNKPRPELLKRYTWAHRYLKGKAEDRDQRRLV